MRKMFSEKQIKEIAGGKSDEEIKDLAWESISEDHGEELAGDVIVVVNDAISQGAISTGKTLYEHFFKLAYSSSAYGYPTGTIRLILDNNTQLTKTTLAQLLFNWGIKTSDGGLLIPCASYNTNSTGYMPNALKIYSVNGESVSFVYFYTTIDNGTLKQLNTNPLPSDLTLDTSYYKIREL